MRKKTTFPDQGGIRFFYPGSVVLVSAVDSRGRADICTVGAWALVNGDPPMFGIAMCTRDQGSRYWKRYTTRCIEETDEFVINIPDSRLEQAWQICGSVSLVRQPDADKFALAGLTPQSATRVRAPLIAECPVNIECRVHARLALPTHDWIVGMPLACHMAEDVVSGRVKFEWDPAPLLQVPARASRP